MVTEPWPPRETGDRTDVIRTNAADDGVGVGVGLAVGDGVGVRVAVAVGVAVGVRVELEDVVGGALVGREVVGSAEGASPPPLTPPCVVGPGAPHAAAHAKTAINAATLPTTRTLPVGR